MSSLYCDFPKQSKKCFDRHCKILASSSFIPPKVVSNEEIIQKCNFPFKSSAFLYSVDAISGFINTGDASASLLFGYSEEKHILASYFYINPLYFDLALAKANPFVLTWNVHHASFTWRRYQWRRVDIYSLNQEKSFRSLWE